MDGGCNRLLAQNEVYKSSMPRGYNAVSMVRARSSGHARLHAPRAAAHYTIIHLGVSPYAIDSSLALRPRYCKLRTDLNV